ncbi:MAG: peptidyl-prolyl cis-trans isomerase [Myxococcota bacterium]
MAELRPMIWIRNIVILGVIAAFIFFFGQPSSQTSAQGDVARIGDERVTRDVFEYFRRNVDNQIRPSLPSSIDDTRARDLIDRQTLGLVVRRVVLAEVARSLGMSATDEEVKREIRESPNFRPAGHFDRTLFDRFAAQFGSPRAYSEEIRHDLLIRKLERLVAVAARVSPEQALEQARRSALRVKIRYARARSADFEPDAEISGEEARAGVERDPERVQALYRRKLHEYRTPEQVHARQILFTGDDAMARAQAALARLDEGEDFAALARELSDDRATRDEGGDLGFFPRGRGLLPEVEQAAFSLAPGEHSGAIETERGVHIVKVEEKRPASERSFDEVRFELARELIREDRARAAAHAAAEQLLKRLEAGEGFDRVARELGMTSDATPLLSVSDPLPPELGPIQGLRGAIFALSPQAPRIERVLDGPDASYVVWLEQRQEADPAELQAQAEDLREKLEGQARARLLARFTQQRQQQLARAGDLELYPLYPTSATAPI